MGKRVLVPRQNPLFAPDFEREIRVQLAEVAQSTRYSTAERTRIIRRLVGQESARQAIDGLAPTVDVFGLTCGQFSLIHLIQAVIAKIGPCSVDVSTWTAATADVADVLGFVREGQIAGLRMIVDASFHQRKPEVLKEVIARFGRDAIRVTKNHAKFVLFRNAEWSIVLKTSMNLNQNPRMEDFDLTCNPELFAFLKDFVEQLFALQTADTCIARDALEPWRRFLDAWTKSRSQP